MDKKKKRNTRIDILRGLAVIMVVFSHVLMFSVEDFANSLVFNIIWTIQMPLFFLISGYLNCYSKQLRTCGDLFVFSKKRTITYLVPWIFWVFIVNYMKDSRGNFFPYIKTVFMNIEAYYWFLFVIWVICIIFGISSYIVSKIQIKHQFREDLLIMLLSFILLLPLLVLSLVIKQYIFGIKYIVYYMAFYLIGYLIRHIKDNMNEKKYEYFTFPVLLIYASLVTNINFYTNPDTLINIGVRFLASLMGCYICFIFVTKMREGHLNKYLQYCGVNSMAIYIVHSLFLRSYAGTIEGTMFSTLSGIVSLLTNFTITFLLTIVAKKVIETSSLGRFLISGKKETHYESSVN